MGQFDITRRIKENQKIVGIIWVLSVMVVNLGVELEKCCAKVGP